MSDYLDKPIIFFGFPRSGTTIISEIIMQHHKLAWVSNFQAKFPNTPSINFLRNLFQNPFWDVRGKKNQLNDVPFFNKYIFKPGESYNFWNTITEREFAKSFLFNIKEHSKRVFISRSFFKKLVRFQNRERLSFKVTGPSRLVYLNSLFPNACFIRIKRDPLPTLRSLLKVGFWNKGDGESKLWWNQEGVYNDEEKIFIQQFKSEEPDLLAALQYYKVDQIHKREQELCGVNILEVKYEDFISNPENTIQEILSFVKLEKDKKIDRYFTENKIHNRNKRKEYFISSELDAQAYSIASEGVASFIE